MNILLVNDDGIYSDGIIALAKALKDEHKVTIIAPERQMSGTSHCITFYGYLNYEKIDILDGVDAYVINGTPCDSTKFGIQVILNGIKPDVVISGINSGLNIGTDVLYSGTCNASIEGSIFQIKSIAVSQDYSIKSYDFSAKFIKDNLDKLLDLIPEPYTTSLSINIPTDNKKILKGTKICRVGNKYYDDYYEKLDAKGYVIRGDAREVCNPLDTDSELIKKNYITISFIKVDFNDYDLYNKHKNFKI